MKCISTQRASLAFCLFTLVMCVIWSSTAFAGMSLPGAGLRGLSKQSESGSSGSDKSSGWRTFKQPVTITHPTKNFQYAIPAGWSALDAEGKDSDDPKVIQELTGNLVKKVGNTVCSFSYTIQPMAKSFPSASSVAAGLKQDRERIQTKEVKETKRRDQGDPKKKCSFIGWQTYEDKRPDPTHNRSIFYRGYDQDNVSYTFGAVCVDKEFDVCKDELLQIIDSVKFCVK